MDDEESEILSKADAIRTKIALRKNESRLVKKSLKNRAIIPRQKTRFLLVHDQDSEMEMWLCLVKMLS